MDLKSLRYFAEIARQKSFTLAAEKLFVTQPTLSRQIADLEEELGHPLFDRTTRKIELTEKGLYLYRQAQTILALVDKVKMETMSTASLTGDITIAGAETPAIATVIEAAAQFQAEHPGVRFHIRSAASNDALEELNLGLVDFAIFMTPIDLANMETIDLPISTRWGLLTNKNGSFAGKSSVKPSDLQNTPLYIAQLRQQESRLVGWLGYPVESLRIVGTYNLLYNASFLPCAGASVLCLDNIVEPCDTQVFLPLDPELPASSVFAWPQSRPKKTLTSTFVATLRRHIDAYKHRQASPLA